MPSTAAAPYLETCLNRVRGFESCVEWLYLDSVGKVTVGVGQMIRNLSIAQTYPFKLNSTPVVASFEDVARDFERVAAMEPDHLPTYYRSAGSVTLDAADIDAILYARVLECDRVLARTFPRYAIWPDAAKLALLDMQYNLGPTRFATYKEMIGALLAGDFEGAMKQCDRNRNQAAFAARNYWTRMQLQQAAEQMHTQQPVLTKTA